MHVEASGENGDFNHDVCVCCLPLFSAGNDRAIAVSMSIPHRMLTAFNYLFEFCALIKFDEVLNAYTQALQIRSQLSLRPSSGSLFSKVSLFVILFTLVLDISQHFRNRPYLDRT